MQTIATEKQFDNEKAEKNIKKLREALGLVEPEKVSYVNSWQVKYLNNWVSGTTVGNYKNYKTSVRSSNAASIYALENYLFENIITQSVSTLERNVITQQFVMEKGDDFIPISLPVQHIPSIQIQDNFGVKVPINHRAINYRHNESEVAREERLRNNAENRRQAIAGQNMLRRYKHK